MKKFILTEEELLNMAYSFYELGHKVVKESFKNIIKQKLDEKKTSIFINKILKDQIKELETINEEIKNELNNVEKIDITTIPNYKWWLNEFKLLENFEEETLVKIIPLLNKALNRYQSMTRMPNVNHLVLQAYLELSVDIVTSNPDNTFDDLLLLQMLEEQYNTIEYPNTDDELRIKGVVSSAFNANMKQEV